MVWGQVLSLSRVQLCTTSWTIACQAPLSMGFSRQEYWSGWPFPPSGDLPNPEIESASVTSPALTGGFFTPSTTCEAYEVRNWYLFKFPNVNLELASCWVRVSRQLGWLQRRVIYLQGSLWSGWRWWAVCPQFCFILGLQSVPNSWGGERKVVTGMTTPLIQILPISIFTLQVYAWDR